MPIIILYIPEIISGYKKIEEKFKIILSVFLSFMLLAFVPGIDYRASSINRFIEGSSISMISKGNFYSENNFPYFDILIFLYSSINYCAI